MGNIAHPLRIRGLKRPTWVMACVAVVVGVTIKKVAEQPYFGGRKDRKSLEEHYIHGEMTTEEYEDRKNHIVTLHVRDNTHL